MAARRYEISLRVLEKYFPSERSDREKYFSTRKCYFHLLKYEFSRERFPGISLVFFNTKMLFSYVKFSRERFPGISFVFI